MIDPVRVLHPVTEADTAVRELADYEAPTALAAALAAVSAAVERSLRLLLRSDAEAPDSLRLAALSPADLPLDRLLETLRQRELVSLELAGGVHELGRAAERAAAGEPRAADADLGRRVVDRLRLEVHALGERPVREAAQHAMSEKLIDDRARPVPPPATNRGRLLAYIAAGVAVVFLLSLGFVFYLGLKEERSEAIEAFQQGRYGVAEAGFRAIVADQPENVDARLYLGRIYRRQGRYPEAAEVLRDAARLAPRDAVVRRELGYLFMDLGRPREAAEQFRRALEQDPDATGNWVGLIRALRAAGDPHAEELLRGAPADVRAALQRDPAPAAP
jgi:tetratricopeptide (TPR) repeat protein